MLSSKLTLDRLEKVEGENWKRKDLVFLGFLGGLRILRIWKS
jgi:hypothetical protein